MSAGFAIRCCKRKILHNDSRLPEKLDVFGVGKNNGNCIKAAEANNRERYDTCWRQGKPPFIMVIFCQSDVVNKLCRNGPHRIEHIAVG